MKVAENSNQMIRKIEYYYLDHFCPVDSMTEAKLAAFKEGHPTVEIQKHNIVESNAELVAHFYFKINDSVVFMGPLFNLHVFERYHATGELPETAAKQHETELFTGSLEYSSYEEAGARDFCSCCSPGREPTNEEVSWKSGWLQSEDAKNVEADGIVGFHRDKPVCAIEWLNLSKMTQRLVLAPKDSAFIICCYPGEGKIDYRFPLLSYCSNELKRRGFRFAYMLSGEASVYPNGPLSFFRDGGFEVVRRIGKVYFTYGNNFEIVYLLKKEL